MNDQHPQSRVTVLPVTEVLFKLSTAKSRVTVLPVTEVLFKLSTAKPRVTVLPVTEVATLEHSSDRRTRPGYNVNLKCGV